MSKKIQAYFPTENDALSANTRIQTYGAEYLEVSELPDPIGTGTRLLVPIAAGLPTSGTPGSATGYAGGTPGSTTNTGGAAATYVALNDNDGFGTSDNLRRGDSVDSDYYDGDRSHLRYVMAATVKDQVYADVVEAIRRNGGYVEVFD
ncbi:hypothetical protein [Gorillibacterium sp. sgz500922]|uniref:hypothetical protein n=1 Tax=Gorillibacterium sp. sgz500922 TaxID=3446694 RepID=UPI003F66ACEF